MMDDKYIEPKSLFSPLIYKNQRKVTVFRSIQCRQDFSTPVDGKSKMVFPMEFYFLNSHHHLVNLLPFWQKYRRRNRFNEKDEKTMTNYFATTFFPLVKAVVVAAKADQVSCNLDCKFANVRIVPPSDVHQPTVYANLEVKFSIEVLNNYSWLVSSDLKTINFEFIHRNFVDQFFSSKVIEGKNDDEHPQLNLQTHFDIYQFFVP